MTTFRDQYLEVTGFNVRYRERPGMGTPVIMIHGIGESAEFWDRQIENGIGSRRLIAVDLPGHGLSDFGDQPYDSAEKFAYFVLAFADVMKLNKFSCIGNSLGGAIAISIAGLAPNRLAAMVLASPAMIGQQVFTPFRFMTLPLLGELMTIPSPIAVKMQLNAMFHDPTGCTAQLRQAITRNTYRKGGSKAFLATLRAGVNFSGIRPTFSEKSFAILRATKIPTLFVHGKQDAVLPVAQSVAAAELTPNAQLVTPDQCGHTPQWEISSKFNALADRFLV